MTTRLDNHGWYVPHFANVVEQPGVRREEAPVDEVVVLDARESLRAKSHLSQLSVLFLRQTLDGSPLSLPDSPKSKCSTPENAE